MTVPYQAPIVPHLALPLTIGPSGSWNITVQDTVAEVSQSVQVLLGTTKGERTMVPDYGVDDPTFITPDPDAIAEAIAQWEPRATATVQLGPATGTTRTLDVAVSLAANPA